jgi:hypothetical protein
VETGTQCVWNYEPSNDHIFRLVAVAAFAGAARTSRRNTGGRASRLLAWPSLRRSRWADRSARRWTRSSKPDFARAALDKDGAVIGYVFESKGFSRVDIDTNESDPVYSLAGQLMGLPLKSLQGFGVPAESYGFANKRLAWETIGPLLDRASPLRTAHLRDPVGPQIQFASGSFIDEVAAAVGGPVAFRLRYLKEPSRYRRRQGGGRARQLAAAPVAAPRPHRRHADRARHRLRPALGCGRRNRR